MQISFRVIVLMLVIFVAAGVASRAEAQQTRKVTRTDLERRKKTPRSQPGSIAVVRDGSAVALFADRLEFFTVPPGIIFDEGMGQLKNDMGVVKPLEIEPQKIMWFDFPYGVQTAGNSILVCTDVSHPRAGTSGVGDFCGILSPQGEVVFKFPVTQRVPDRMLRILGLNGDGTYAEVFVGRLVAGEDGDDIGAPREVLAWRYPNKFTRFPGPWKDGKPKEPGAIAFDNLLQGFKVREKQH